MLSTNISKGVYEAKEIEQAQGKANAEEQKSVHLHIHNENKPQFTNAVLLVQNTTASPVDLSNIEALLKQLTEAQKAQLKTFVETLPEPEDAREKESTGKQIAKWLNKNAEGIVLEVAAASYYDVLKTLFGL